MPALDLPTSPISACWALLRDRLRNDTTLKNARVDFEFAEDLDIVRNPMEGRADGVTVLVDGGIGPWDFHTEHEHSCALLLRFRVALETLDFQDVANLVTSIHAALYDDTNADTFRVDLTDAGAATGYPRWTRPLAPQPTRDANIVVLAGEMALEVRTPIFGA